MKTLTVASSARLIWLAILLSLGMLFSAKPTTAAPEDVPAPGRNVLSTAQQQGGPTDPAELEAFLDDLMTEQMEEHHIPGAAVSVVKDGELFFAKGYGYADLENQIPVDPERTLFRIGSTEKTFIATAVMQLYEQGLLDLDADINTYLDFQIPDTYPEPITLKHLMTHTAGFENRGTDIGYNQRRQDAHYRMNGCARYAGTRTSAGTGPGLFQLLGDAGPIYRRACIGAALRAVPRGEHPGTPGDGAHDRPAATATRSGPGLLHRLRLCLTANIRPQVSLGSKTTLNISHNQGR